MNSEITKQIIKALVPALVTALLAFSGHVLKMDEAKAKSQYDIATTVQNIMVVVNSKKCEGV